MVRKLFVKCGSLPFQVKKKLSPGLLSSSAAAAAASWPLNKDKECDFSVTSCCQQISRGNIKGIPLCS